MFSKWLDAFILITFIFIFAYGYEINIRRNGNNFGDNIIYLTQHELYTL